MKLLVATLCDFASVREGMLNVVSGGVTRVNAPALPAPMNVFVALQLELSPKDARLPHEVAIDVEGPGGGTVVQVRGGLQVGQGAYDPDENRLAAMPLDLRMAGLAEYGWYTVKIKIDGMELGELAFKVQRPAPPPQPQGIRMAPPSRRQH